MSRSKFGVRKPHRRSSEVSRALEQARHDAKLSYAEIGRALGTHPRTFRRWERGESKPREAQWQNVLALYAHRAPAVAQTLAASVGRALPVIAHAPALSPHAVSHVVSMAADAVDVAPKRVREVLRAVAQASAEAGIPLEVLARMVAAEAERG